MSESASTQKNIVYCYNCGRRGHCGYECRERRMYSSVHPSCELIFTYDEDYDIRKRKQRAKRKCEELQEAGLLPSEIIEPKKDEKESSRLSKKNRKKQRKESKREENKVNCHLQVMNKSKKKKNKLVKQEEEADFPRGKPEGNPGKGTQQHKKKKREHLLFKYGKDKKDFDGQQKKRKKKMKKGSNANDDLLTIKQRKKKSRKGA